MNDFEYDYPDNFDEEDELDISQMVEGYIQAALWSSMDTDTEGGLLDEKYTASNVSQELKASVEEQCRSFYEDNQTNILKYFKETDRGASGLGHDFWMTRSELGSGFLDRDGLSEDIAKTLMQGAHEYGQEHWFVQEDGQINSDAAVARMSYQKEVEEDIDMPIVLENVEDVDLEITHPDRPHPGLSGL